MSLLHTHTQFHTSCKISSERLPPAAAYRLTLLCSYIKQPCAFAGPDYGAMMSEPPHPHHYPLHLGLPDMVAPHMNPHLGGFCKPEVPSERLLCSG